MWMTWLRKTIAAGTATQRTTARLRQSLEYRSWLEYRSSSSAHRRSACRLAAETAATLRGGPAVRQKIGSAILRAISPGGREVSSVSRQEKPRQPLFRCSQNSQKCSHALRSKSLSGVCATGFVPRGAVSSTSLSLKTPSTQLSTRLFQTEKAVRRVDPKATAIEHALVMRNTAASR
jgi:hypothetical protein